MHGEYSNYKKICLIFLFFANNQVQIFKSAPLILIGGAAACRKYNIRLAEVNIYWLWVWSVIGNGRNPIKGDKLIIVNICFSFQYCG